MFSIKSASVLLVSLLAVGCSAEASDRAASSESAVETETTTLDFKSGSFKLYADPESTPLPECDVHTRLVLKSNGSKAIAQLSEVVSGSCEIYVEPNSREFAVEYEMSRCGSLTFSGETVIKGETRHIAITDHRQRLCNDVQPSLIVVDEYDRLGNVTTRFAGR